MWRRRVRGPLVPEGTLAAAAATQGLVLDTSQLEAATRLETMAGQGIYLWGPPGRGKSWLMDTFLAEARTSRTTRTHCHRFFTDLHAELNLRGHDLDAALDQMLGDAELVCFDEFHVHDPADGIFVDRLLDALFRRPVRVILTSNYPPRRLLPNPLFHSKFEPTIHRIEQALAIVHVDGPIDYRTLDLDTPRSGFAAGRWMTGDRFSDRREPGDGDAASLSIGVRTVVARAVRPDLVWFTFDALCARPTAPSDFLELADRFPRWVISEVPGPDRLGRDAAHRFGSLVDVLYDASIRTDFLAEVPLGQFLLSRHLPVDAERMASRLSQLQTTP
ncbi:cell division protein ZapE [Rhodococcus sp. MEB041]|uniref:cell division protein ZapE n=1 Tax=Rhodococcus sp. MEB041 TaxID=3040323 RepID=UPI00254ADAF3|nr:cell division protein ZapE [Rhodococcus sp. MEB041]